MSKINQITLKWYIYIREALTNEIQFIVHFVTSSMRYIVVFNHLYYITGQTFVFLDQN